MTKDTPMNTTIKDPIDNSGIAVGVGFSVFEGDAEGACVGVTIGIGVGVSVG